MPSHASKFALVLLLASAASASAQGLAIDHKTVKCIVAGKYPRLNACFAPASGLARARVYFRVVDAPPDWYYVEMKSDAPCHSGILPKPKRELVGKHVQYYLDAVDRQFAVSRTSETDARVVARESDCEDRGLVAPWLSKAPVTVFPRLPLGFAAAGGGIGSTALIVGGGAAVVGGGAKLITGGRSSSTTTTTVPTTIPPTPTTTTTTTTTPAAGTPFNPVFKVFRDGVLQGDVISGADPLTLVFDMCETTGPYPLRFNVEVDGTLTTATCRSTITFTEKGAVASKGLAGRGVRASGTRAFAVAMNIRSVAANNDPKATRRVSVSVSGATCTDTQGPVVRLLLPPDGASYPGSQLYPVHFEAFADDSTTGNSGIAAVEYKVDWSGSNPVALGPVGGGAPWPFDWTETAVNAYLSTACTRRVTLQAWAQDGCGNATFSAPVTVALSSTASICAVFGGATAVARPEPSASAVSDLGVPGGSGQVVVNGEAAFPRAGRAALSLRVAPGENRVEATLVGGGSPGTWRFELGAVPGLQAGSLRVVAGEVAEVGADAVVFRLRGRPGERLVFSFLVER